MIRAFAVAGLLCFCTFPVAAAHDGSHAEYIGGTRPDIPANNSGEIRVTDNAYFVFVSKHTRVQVPYERINLLEYGQKVDRRYIVAVVVSPLFMLAKKRQHFLTIGFQDDDGRQQAMVFRVDKNDIRLTLVALEARTGQPVQYQDEEARIAGKG
jgi:6-phosphogluconolactonase (cycloisomerase 2 family)